MKKKIFFILLIIVMLFTGCSTHTTSPKNDTQSQEKKSYNFIFVCPIIENEYWKECIDGIKQADSELGTTTTVIGPKSADNYSAEIVDYMKSAIEQKPDAIVAYAGIEAMFPYIEQATEKGIPVFALDSDAPSTSRIAYIGTDSYNAGYNAAEKMIELTGGSAKVGLLVSSQSAEKEMLVLSAFQDTVHDYNIEIVDIEETDANPDVAEQKARKMLSEHPEITAIFNTAGYNTTGAARVKKELGRDDLVLIGFDDVKENIQFVREGVIDAILVQKIRQAGYQSIYLINEYLEKGFLSKESYDSGTILVTQENVDTYNTQTHLTNTENKEVKVGYYQGDDNFQNGFSDSARKTGYAYEFYQKIASVAGWDYSYYYGTRQEIIDMLKNGDVDIAAGIYKTDELDGKVLYSDYDMGLNGLKRYFAVNSERTDLITDLNNAMTQIQQSTPDFTVSLLQKYYNESSVQVLNEEEKEWLSEKKELKLGYISNNLPISDQDENGEPTGVVKDLITVMKKYMMVDITTSCYETTDDMQSALINGHIDIAFPMYSDIWYSEKNGICQTDSFINDRVMIVYNGDYSNDLFDKVAISKTNISQEYYLETYYANSQIVYYDSKAKALDDVESGKQNCVVACSSVMQHFLRENSKYQNLNIAYLDTSENFSMSVARNNSLLLSILNKAIRNTDDAVITSAMIKYSNVGNNYSLSEIIRQYSTAFISFLLIFITILATVFYAFMKKTKAFNKEQAKTKQALEIALEKANSASEAKTNFLSSISHDIRTPMNAIIGMTSIAQRNLDSEEKTKECLEKIDSSSRHLLTLINNVLDISKIESGKLQLNPSAFSLNKAMNTIIEIVQPRIEQKKLDFVVDIDRIDCDIVYADEVRLNQIFINILSNAVKYTPNNGRVSMTLTEEALPEDNLVRLTYIVEDNGVGMTEEFMQNMYNTFSRANDSRINRIQGTGLGLAIVKQMVDMMYGTIDCVSEVGKGTKFTITIDVPSITLSEDNADSNVEVDDAEGEEKGILNNIHILIAEDNELNWEVASELLSIYGITAERAENGQICVDKLISAEAGTYDLILMDVQMPVMNGHEATRLIRSDERDYINSIPIIAMTADAFAEDIAASINAGMNGHVSKPIDINKLFQEIVKAISPKKD